jgi:peptidoglycan/xylan/chitin deacetylase (PgdA/CDA1 family)
VARGWKGLIERSIAATAIPGLLQRWQMPSTVVLAYHNIVPTGARVAGEQSLHVDQADFAAQLDLIQSSHTVIPLEDLDNPGSDADGRPRAIITFDDAYAGALLAGVEELERRGLPATFFVTPGPLGAEGFWWDLLAERGIGDQVRDHCLWALQGRHDQIMDWAADRGKPADRLPPHARPGDHAALGRVAHSSGITFGAHTWSHPNLAALADTEVLGELSRSQDWLREQGVRCSNWLTYPYGLANPQVTAAAATMFDGALLISGGLAKTRGRTGPTHSLPRVNVSRLLTLDGLRLRLAGLIR